MKTSNAIPLRSKLSAIMLSSRGSIILLIGGLMMMSSVAKVSAQWYVGYNDYSVSADTSAVPANDANFNWWTDDFRTATPYFSADETELVFTGAGYAEAYVDVRNTSTGFNSSHNANTSFGGVCYVIWNWGGEPGEAPDEIVGIEFSTSGTLSVSGSLSFNGGTHTLAATSSASGNIAITDFSLWAGGSKQGTATLNGSGYSTTGSSSITSYNLSSSGNSTFQSFNNSVTYSMYGADYPLNTGGAVPEMWATGTFSASASATIALNSSNPASGSCYSYADVSGYCHIAHYY